jgi:ribonucleoside-diphosphate reductase alpha chain
VVINKHLVADLDRAGLWNERMKELIVAHNGSIQKINGIPDSMKQLYKTAWEISQRVLIDQSADRGMYVCQSQSLNLFTERPSIKSLSSMHFYSWERGLKTGVYYLRTQPAARPIQVSVAPDICVSCSA